MLAIHDALRAADLPTGVVATIGNYDGVHNGQRSVIDFVTNRAREQGASSAVITFDPHPLKVLRPESAPRRLVTQQQKEELLDEAGVDYVLTVSFTHDFATTPARRFVRDFLCDRLQVKEVYVGSDFTFGHRREGDISLLKQMGESFGFEAFPVDEVRMSGERVSSSRIRQLLAEGKVDVADRLLGRPYAMTGIVTRGDQMGQKLGWPTINLASENELVPLDGVYATRVRFPAMNSTFDSVTNIGTRPTVYENYERVVESHILEFSNNVYGEAVEVSFFERLREEKMFQSMMDLSAQIGRDVETAREFFRRHADQQEHAAP